MKKLMTLLSAAAVAFGLQAVDTGTSFEGMDAGDLNITSSTGELVAETSGYWVTNGNEKASLTVTYGTSVSRKKTELTVPQFAEADQDYYLSIKTPFGNPVVRRVKNSAVVQPIGDGFYFDSQVKFTAFDEDPMGTAVTNDFDGAKIAVWAREVYGDENDPERVTGTNLWIRAGYLGSEPVSYNCGGLPNPAAWHRLTIKAIRNIYASGDDVPGFVVYIDNQPVYTIDETTKGIVANNLNEAYTQLNSRGGLYPSMVQGDAGAVTSIASVSFDGQGEVDDIVFTETAPDFAKDAEYVHINWTPADIESLTIAGNVLNGDEIAAGSYAVTYEDNLVVNVSVSYVEGKVDGAWSTTGSATTVPGESFTFTASDGAGTIVAANAVASFQGTPYASLADAIAAAEAASTTVPSPVLKLYNTSASDNIGTLEKMFAPLAELIVIDLNGQEIGQIKSGSTLKIIDSVGGGTVNGEVELGDGSIIGESASDDITFDEMVTLGEGSVINGGRFILALNLGTIEDFAAEGYEFVADEDYLVLVPATPKFDFAVTAGDNSYVSNVSIDNVDVTTDVTNGTITVIASNVAWSVTFTANSGYEFEGGLTTTNFTGTAEAAVDLTGPDANKQQGGGWVDPGTIPADTDAGTQYPELADSDLAETDAKKLTEWADTYTVGIADVAAAAPNSVIYDAYLLGCEPTAAAVAEAKADLVPSIAIVDGEVVVTEPDGDYNGTFIKKGSADLETWTDANELNEGNFNFFKYELVP